MNMNNQLSLFIQIVCNGTLTTILVILNQVINYEALGGCWNALNSDISIDIIYIFCKLKINKSPVIKFLSAIHNLLKHVLE